MSLVNPKTCKGCSRLLPASDFDLKKAKNGSYHLSSHCRSCRAEIERKRRAKKGKVYKADYRDQRYGLAPGWYDNKLSQQDGVCAVCGGTNDDGSALGVDHDHTTYKVRGLLCDNCNRAEGLLTNRANTLGKRNIQIIRALADYLEKYDGNPAN